MIINIIYMLLLIAFPVGVCAFFIHMGRKYNGE